MGKFYSPIGPYAGLSQQQQERLKKKHIRKTRTAGAATVHWINQRSRLDLKRIHPVFMRLASKSPLLKRVLESDEVTLLPEHDGAGPGAHTSITAIQSQEGFRFANLLYNCGYVTRDHEGIYPHIPCSPQSGMFTALGESFLGIPIETYPVKTVKEPGSDVNHGKIIVTQTVGCRTHSPEVIGERIGAAVAEETARQLNVGPLLEPVAKELGKLVGHLAAEGGLIFPPIWSRLRVTFNLKASPVSITDIKVLAHSRFPSMYQYKSHSDEDRFGLWRVHAYDGVPHLHQWIEHGWGPEAGGGGPSDGNPYNIPRPPVAAISAAAEQAIESLLKQLDPLMTPAPKPTPPKPTPAKPPAPHPPKPKDHTPSYGWHR